MDSEFEFLTREQFSLVEDILGRRDLLLLNRIRRSGIVARRDADAIVSILGDELISNLDADWEPTEYGQRVSVTLARLNRARLIEWPYPLT